MKRAFRSVQTPSAPSAEEEKEEEVISTFGGFLMKADSEGIPGPSTNNRSESEGGSAGGRAGRRGHGRGAAVARLLAPGGHHQHVGGAAPDAGEIDTPDSLRQIIAASTFSRYFPSVLFNHFSRYHLICRRYHQAAAPILKSGILHFRKVKCARGTRPQTNASLTKIPRYHQAAASILKSGILHFRKEKWTRGTWSWALWRTKVAKFAAADESAQKLKHLKRTNPHKFKREREI